MYMIILWWCATIGVSHTLAA